MLTQALHTGSTAYPELAKHHWLILSVKDLMNESSLLGPFSVGEMTRI